MTGRAYQARLPANALRSESVLFTQTAGDGTYTEQIVVPAGAYIRLFSLELLADWDSTTAVLTVGDGADPDGFYAAFDLIEWGGAPGANSAPGGAKNFSASYGPYLGGSANQGGTLSSPFSAVARTITATLVQTGVGTAGRTRLTVGWNFGETAAVKA